jgi:hypothetical protein
MEQVMTDEELWARLEAWEPLVSSGHIVSRAGQDLRQAADRLKALTAEVERWRGMLEMVLRESVDIECGERILYAGTVNDIRAALEEQP